MSGMLECVTYTVGRNRFEPARERLASCREISFAHDNQTRPALGRDGKQMFVISDKRERAIGHGLCKRVELLVLDPVREVVEIDEAAAEQTHPLFGGEHCA